MAHISIYYEIPIFIFIVLALYTIYKLNRVKTYMAEGALRKSFFWIVLASIFFTIWGIVHVLGDFFSPTAEIEFFSHYLISHVFLLISMICLAISASKIEESYKELEGELGFGKKKK